MMTQQHDQGASANADQALVSDGAPADRHPAGFDPSRDPIIAELARQIAAGETESQQ